VHKNSGTLLRSLVSAFIIFATLLPSVWGQTLLKVAGWNVERGFMPDAELGWISARLKDFNEIDIWGLTEISRGDIQEYVSAAADGENARFDSIVSKNTHGTDLMAIVYNANRFNKLWHAELEGFNYALMKNTKNQRPPIAAHFYDKKSQRYFVFMVNHLARGEEKRNRQAQRLNQWVREQSVPIIAVGDYNFDWDVEDGEINHNRAYDYFTAGDGFRWIRPDILVRTQCSPFKLNGEITCKYNSVLDFIFTANEAAQWQSQSRIVIKEGDFPDDKIKSDHRPVMAEFLIPLQKKS